jgi:hypothetical protein
MKSTAKIHAIFSRPEVFTDIEIMINGKSHTNAQIAKKSNSINKYITKLVLLEKARELRKIAKTDVGFYGKMQKLIPLLDYSSTKIVNVFFYPSQNYFHSGDRIGFPWMHSQ